MPPKLKKLNSLLTCSVLLSTLIAFTLTQSGCLTKKRQDPYKEGEVVTWKLWGKMIIKAEVGERRKHLIAMTERGEREFYRPEDEHYLGQFPIDYQPKQFATLTKKEARALPITPILPFQALEFNLMLNGSWVQATDNSIIADNGLDHPDQVKVLVNHDYITENTKQFFNLKLLPELDVNSTHTINGVTCYRFSGEKGEYNHQRCFGDSLNPNVSGFEFYIPITETARMYGHMQEPLYGGIKITWAADRKNLNQAQAIDSAIWRLLDAWNISPFAEPPLSPPA